MLDAVHYDIAHELDSVRSLLGVIFHPISRLLERQSSPHQRPEFKDLVRSTTRIWHDVSRQLRDAPTRSLTQSQVKSDALDLWRRVGVFVGLKERTSVTTLEKPSTPSEEEEYWKIPRRCFYEACVCAGVAPSSHHHNLRVCKGCWRVLYCNTRCQDLDWKAGHRLICRALSADQ